jgi:hypothetical protein
MGGSGKNEKESWSGARLAVLLASLVYGQHPGTADGRRRLASGPHSVRGHTRLGLDALSN